MRFVPPVLAFAAASPWQSLGGANVAYIALDAQIAAEDASTGTEIGNLSVANSPSGVTWTFSITADPDSKFQLDGVDDTILEVGAALDYETATSHEVEITATPSAGDAIARVFPITITDVLDTPYLSFDAAARSQYLPLVA